MSETPHACFPSPCSCKTAGRTVGTLRLPFARSHRRSSHACAVQSSHVQIMPGGKHDNMKAWEPEEDRIIMAMVRDQGPKWKNIVKELPTRTVRTPPSDRAVAAAAYVCLEPCAPNSRSHPPSFAGLISAEPISTAREGQAAPRRGRGAEEQVPRLWPAQARPHLPGQASRWSPG